MEVRFPFGGSLRASGRIVIGIILTFGLAALFIWHDVKSTQQNTAVVEALRDISYVLTLSETERKKLHLDMPESLRRTLQGASEHRARDSDR